MSVNNANKPGTRKIGKLTLDMKITERDKKLLFVFAVVAVIALSFYILYPPLSAKLTEVKAERLIVDQKVKQAKIDLANEQGIIQVYQTELNRGIEASAAFFPKVYPFKDRYVLLLDKILRGNEVTISSVEFSDPEISGVAILPDNRFSLPNYSLGNNALEINKANPEVQEAMIKKNNTNMIPKDKDQKNTTLAADAVVRLPVTLDFQGTYGQYRSVISSLEKLNRALAIESVKVDKKEAQISAKIEMSFYIVDKVDNGADKFNDWTITGTYGKGDPFN